MRRRDGGWRSSRSSARKRLSSGVPMRDACLSKSVAIRSSRRAMPRPVFADVVTIGRPLAQAALEPRAHVLDLDGRLVPLREHDERRALRLAGDVGHGQVLLDDAFGGVDEDERDVRPVRGLERAQLRVVLDALAVLALAPHAGRVHEHERAVVGLEHRVDRVARRSRNVRDDQPLLPEQGVEEARLADVRPAEHGHADRLVRHRLRPSRRAAARARRRAGLPCRGRGARRSRRARRSRASRTRALSSGRDGIVELVRDEQHGLARPAQDVGRARRRPASGRRGHRRGRARGRPPRSPPAPGRRRRA